jgi:hypothetical protein
MKNRLIVLGLIIFFHLSASWPLQAQEFDDTAINDTLEIFSDSMEINYLDSLAMADSVFVQKQALQFYNSTDTLLCRFLIRRLSLADEPNRSFQHDAADYLRLRPSNFIKEEQCTPYRKTVAPFAINGNRINAIYNNRTLNPLEHIPQPDNQIDFNDIPTAAVANIYNIEGPLGLAFGAENTTSSLIMTPFRPETTRAESRLVVDKGDYGYSNTKALFAHRTIGGQSIRAGIEYRRADGAAYYQDDDSYHQWGELIYPLGDRIRVNLNGRLYRRRGTYNLLPDISGFTLARSRRDRDLSASIAYYHSPSASSSIEFRHQRSESNLDEYTYQYKRRIDNLDNSLRLNHDRKWGEADIRSTMSIAQEEYNDSSTKMRRLRGSIDTRYLRGNEEKSLFSYLRIEKVENFAPGIATALGYLINRPEYYLLISAGYTTKFPRQYELYLKPQTTNILAGGNPDYYESGDSALKAEKQITASISSGYGRVGNEVLVSVTGGHIHNGIDWYSKNMNYSGVNLTAWQAGNANFDFLTVSAQKNISFGNRLHWSGKGSYHYINYTDDIKESYYPDYQLFSNLELYHYWGKLDIHLYGYGEIIYSGPYYGVDLTPLGEQPIINLKLSFRIKSFRFHYVFQNILNRRYQWREYYTIPGGFNYYGFVWNFLD